LNITFNYSSIFEKVLEGGIRSIDGKCVVETIPTLAFAIGQLADDNEPDYWKATEGNARRALLGLLALAIRSRVLGTWKVL
jgi:hypothetical protein